MRYLLVDHIKAWDAGKSIQGVKNVAMSEDFLEFHFPNNPIMPGVMLLEALSQLAGWLVAASSDFSGWFLVSKVNKSSFYGFALPGDQVDLDVQVVREESPGQMSFKGVGTVNGKKKIVTTFEGNVVPLNLLDDGEQQKNHFMILTRNSKK